MAYEVGDSVTVLASAADFPELREDPQVVITRTAQDNHWYPTYYYVRHPQGVIEYGPFTRFEIIAGWAG